MTDLPKHDPRRAFLRRCAPLAVSIFLLAACGDAAAPPPVPSSLAVTETGPLAARVGTALAAAPQVIALDEDAQPLRGVTVTFQVLEGGGTIARTSARTDAAGLADPGTWSLGTAAGRNVLSASAAGAAAVQVTATAEPGPAATLTTADGAAAQTAYRGTAVADGPAVRVADAYGNAVAGAVVEFVVVEGGGSVERPSATSDMYGVASAGTWHLGPVAGRNVLRAYLGAGGGGGGSAGADGTAEFQATGVEPIADRLVIFAGDAQTAAAGAAVATAPAVRTLDAAGQPLPGVSVAFSTTTGAVGAAGATAVTVLSDADGIAAVAAWTLGTAVGPQALTATATASPGVTAAFAATAVAGPPAAVAVVAGDGQTAQAGQNLPVQPAVRVTDAHGNIVAGATVSFEVTAGGGAIVPATTPTDADGVARALWRLGPIAGANRLTASAGAASATLTAVATAPPQPPTMAAWQGNGQSAVVGMAVAVAPTVIVRTAQGAPVQGVTVTFAATQGGGSVIGATQTTNASGIATVGGWTLGATPGPNALTASAPGLVATFTATATSAAPPTGGFRIELRYLSTLTAAQQAAFESAANRWSSVITGDLPALSINVPAGGCTPAMNETIDDLVVFVRTAPIDGAGGTIASAGPCYVRSGGGKPAVGRITVDEADIANMLANGSLVQVVVHELGHVLGVGTNWSGGLVGNGGADPYFTGATALSQYVAIGGTGAGVPVEATGGAGTAYAHWRESVFATEVMTGWIDVGRANPLSSVTVGLLADVGYAVSLGAADAYALPSAGLKSDAALGDTRFEVRELPLPPPRRIGPDGRPTG